MNKLENGSKFFYAIDSIILDIPNLILIPDVKNISQMFKFKKKINYLF